MLRLLRFLITGDGHMHKWRATSQAVWSRGDTKGPVVFAVCEHCGARKAFKNATIGKWEEEDGE